MCQTVEHKDINYITPPNFQHIQNNEHSNEHSNEQDQSPGDCSVVGHTASARQRQRGDSRSGKVILTVEAYSTCYKYT